MIRTGDCARPRLVLILVQVNHEVIMSRSALRGAVRRARHPSSSSRSPDTAPESIGGLDRGQSSRPHSDPWCRVRHIPPWKRRRAMRMLRRRMHSRGRCVARSGIGIGLMLGLSASSVRDLIAALETDEIKGKALRTRIGARARPAGPGRTVGSGLPAAGSEAREAPGSTPSESLEARPVSSPVSSASSSVSSLSGDRDPASPGPKSRSPGTTQPSARRTDTRPTDSGSTEARSGLIKMRPAASAGPHPDPAPKPPPPKDPMTPSHKTGTGSKAPGSRRRSGSRVGQSSVNAGSRGASGARDRDPAPGTREPESRRDHRLSISRSSDPSIEMNQRTGSGAERPERDESPDMDHAGSPGIPGSHAGVKSGSSPDPSRKSGQDPLGEAVYDDGGDDPFGGTYD